MDVLEPGWSRAVATSCVPVKEQLFIVSICHRSPNYSAYCSCINKEVDEVKDLLLLLKICFGCTNGIYKERIGIDIFQFIGGTGYIWSTCKNPFLLSFLIHCDKY